MKLLDCQKAFSKFVGQKVTLVHGEYSVKSGQNSVKRPYLATNHTDPVTNEIRALAASFNMQAVFRGVQSRLESDAYIYIDLERETAATYRIKGVEARWA
jgi:hypothetical protein